MRSNSASKAATVSTGILVYRSGDSCALGSDTSRDGFANRLNVTVPSDLMVNLEFAPLPNASVDLSSVI
jgi:hypothetical protein